MSFPTRRVTGEEQADRKRTRMTRSRKGGGGEGRSAAPLIQQVVVWIYMYLHIVSITYSDITLTAYSVCVFVGEYGRDGRRTRTSISPVHFPGDRRGWWYPSAGVSIMNMACFRLLPMG